MYKDNNLDPQLQTPKPNRLKTTLNECENIK